MLILECPLCGNAKSAKKARCVDCEITYGKRRATTIARKDRLNRHLAHLYRAIEHHEEKFIDVVRTSVLPKGVRIHVAAAYTAIVSGNPYPLADIEQVREAWAAVGAELSRDQLLTTIRKVIS